MPKVLITDASDGAALAVIRSLGKKNIGVALALSRGLIGQGSLIYSKRK